ncbi:osteoclast stimulatory transmembrane protein [Amia ocellicauda]|uniref:osteoclast stimulatory transmembrane protein n=1 Tax=Amia ocellicauda TaxID=2972642 RepID=UPI003464277A
MWDVYSKPTPSNLKEVLVLFFICLCFALTAGGLLYSWMIFKLHYEELPSRIVAGCVCFSIVLLIFLVHPVRCMFTIMIPTLGTKQGLKIIISAALVFSITRCAAHVALNMDMIADIVKCSTLQPIEKILNSTTLVNSALDNIVNVLNRVPAIIKKEKHLNLAQNLDVSQLTRTLVELSTNVRRDFSVMENFLWKVSSVVDKIIGAIFILYLVGGSAWYLASYLTDLKFDNIYISQSLLELAKARGQTDIPSYDKIKLVRTTGWKMTRQEMKRTLWGIMMLVPYVLISVMLIGMDYFIYFVLEETLSWTAGIQESIFSFETDLELKYHIDIVDALQPVADVFGAKINIQTYKDKKEYRISHMDTFCVEKSILHSYTVGNCPIDHCIVDCGSVGCRTADNYTEVLYPVSVTVGFLYLIAFIMVLGQVYARRLCRKIAASFFRKQEEERVAYLFEEIVVRNYQK